MVSTSVSAELFLTSLRYLCIVSPLDFLFLKVRLLKGDSNIIVSYKGRYLARKHGLAGGDLQMARIDAIAEGISDLSAKLREAFRYPVDSERPAKVLCFSITSFWSSVFAAWPFGFFTLAKLTLCLDYQCSWCRTPSMVWLLRESHQGQELFRRRWNDIRWLENVWGFFKLRFVGQCLL